MTPADVLGARLSAWRPPGARSGSSRSDRPVSPIRSGDDLVLIDPFLSPRPERLIAPVIDPRGLAGVTAVLATHEHGDHLDLPTWAIIADDLPERPVSSCPSHWCPS